ncbi:MAG: hypothetical protein IJT44_12475 [Clostridia bacterium]|nr:hypothetical protein [Clostridia bacterium]
MKKFLFYLVQFTWGLPQNLIGLIGFLFFLGRMRHDRFENAIITYIDSDKSFGGISLGIFIFVNGRKKDDWLHDTRIHEYGHTIQSVVLGPLYILVIGIPSMIWCNLPPIVRYRKEHDVSYYTIYCEGWANLWGSRFSGKTFVTDELLRRGRFGKPWKQ